MNDLTNITTTPLVYKAEVIPDVKLHDVEGEPRALDLDIAKRLGFTRPRDIRKLIERHRPELERFGTCATVARVVRGNPTSEYFLNEEQALSISALSDAEHAPAVRHMLIKVFVAWRRGHLVPGAGSAVPDSALEMIERSFGINRMLAHKVTEIEKLIATIAATVMPSRPILYREGKTAGQIWRAAGFPATKGIAVWFGNRLEKFNCRVPNNACAEMGLTKARLFDPDKADFWLENGGRAAVAAKMAERQGQGRLRLIPGGAS